MLSFVVLLSVILSLLKLVFIFGATVLFPNSEVSIDLNIYIPNAISVIYV